MIFLYKFYINKSRGEYSIMVKGKKDIGLIILISLLVAVAIGLVCFLAGKSVGKERELIIPANKAGVKVNEENSQMIAVVNLDEGSVSSNQEKIYYGEKVIQFPDEFYIYTSLEDARKGIENGSYGAYIVIPSTFSNSVESLNKTPTPAEFQYALNTKMTKDSQMNVLYRVLNFGESINTDLSYMYLVNILEEFHRAQDEAMQVMENDKKEKEVIEQVKAQDLIAMVPIPELTKEENTMVPVNISDNIKKNSDLVNGIDEFYKTNLEDSAEQLTQLQNNGKLLSNSLDALSKNIKKIDLTKDEKGTIVYEKGLQSLMQHLTEYKNEFVMERDSNVCLAGNLEEDSSNIIIELKNSISKYNEQLNIEKDTLLEQHKLDLKASLAELTLTQEGLNEQQYKLTCNPIKEGDTPPVVWLTVIIDQEDDKRKEECFNAIINKLISATSETETIEVTLEKEIKETTKVEEAQESQEEETQQEEETENRNICITDSIEINKSVATVLKECNSDSELLKLMNECGYESAEEVLSEWANGNSKTELKAHLEIEGNIEQLQAYLESGMEDILGEKYQLPTYDGTLFDENGNSILDKENNAKTVMTLLLNYQEKVKEIAPQISSIKDLDVKSVNDIVTNTCISPLLTQTEKVKGIFDERYVKEIEEINTYQNAMTQYNPVKDTTKVGELVSQMEHNNSSMQESVLKNNQDYMDFTEKVYSTTDENLNILKDHLEEAKERSNQAVENGVLGIKSLNAATSKDTQERMKDFASKLPYTRLGSMEYIQAYEFIVNPMKMTPISRKEK